MKTHFFCICLFFIACSTNRQKQSVSKKEEKKVDTSTCLLTLKIDRNDFSKSLYGFRFYDAQQLVKSVDFIKTPSLVLFNFPELRISFEKKLIAIDTLSNKVCVNDDYFSDLVLVDATRLGDTHVLGEIKPALFSEMNCRNILVFLMHAEIIQTYQHLYADVCLVKEEEYGDNYEAQFTAVHHYCTNECIDEPYKFTVIINKKTGIVNLRP